jgi:hypothetical protein
VFERKLEILHPGSLSDFSSTRLRCEWVLHERHVRHWKYQTNGAGHKARTTELIPRREGTKSSWKTWSKVRHGSGNCEH